MGIQGCLLWAIDGRNWPALPLALSVGAVGGRAESYQTTCQDPLEAEGLWLGSCSSLSQVVWDEPMRQRAHSCDHCPPSPPWQRNPQPITNLHGHPFSCCGPGTSSPGPPMGPRGSRLPGGPGLYCYFESQSRKLKFKSDSSALPIILYTSGSPLVYPFPAKMIY